MPERLNPQQVPAGVVGLGLMGSSIAACMVAAGHSVVGVEPDSKRRKTARKRVGELLEGMAGEGLLSGCIEDTLARFNAVSEYRDLKASGIVIEAIYESPIIKREVLDSVEQVVGKSTLIGCNTSAIPISHLQRGAKLPRRVLGVHWAEPAHITRFLEIICGEQTSLPLARKVVRMARWWGKEPTLLRRDIRGFITNRCFYALLREALYLVENGYATVADVDRSLRNDLGYWMTFAGPFRFMDLTGIPAYEAVAKDLFPELDNSTSVGAPLARLAKAGAQGVSNARGFYKYTPEQAKRWEELFLKFSYEVRALAQKYPEDIGDRRPATA